MLKKAIQYGKPAIIPKEYVSLSDMLIETTKKYPNKGMTYIDGSGNEDYVSYEELLDSALKKLQALYQAGLKQGNTLILVIDNSKEFYQAFWACLLGGIIPAPVSRPFSWEEGTDGLQKLSRIWEVLEKPYILIEERNKKDCELLKRSTKYKELNFLVTQEISSEDKAEIYHTNLDDLIFLQFSSGSTGLPKGVKLTNRNILTNLVAISQTLEISEEDVSFTWVPHTHDMGMFIQHLAPIFCGSSIMVFSPYTFVRTPYLFLKKISEHKGSWFCSTNFGFDWMVRNISDEKLDSLDLSSLRFTLNGAEPISVEVTTKFSEKFSQCGYRENMMLPCYGLAEGTVAVTASIIGNLPWVVRVSRSKLINDEKVIFVNPEDEDKVEFYNEGYSFGGVNIRIADEKGNVLNEEEIGEIQIEGDSVTTGYYKNDEVTKEIFCGEWLKTGDLGFMTEGSLVITGRKKDVIFVRGQNYYAHDLEEVMYKHKIALRGNLVFAGCFNSRLQKEELLVFVKDRLKVEAFIPLRERIMTQMNESLGIDITHVIPVRTIPKTTSGKIQRYVLRDSYENGEFDSILSKLESYEDQKNKNLENYLQHCWSEILEIPKEKLSIDDSFRSLGCNSIKLYQFLSKLENHLDREIGGEVFQRCKTIRQIAEYVRSLPREKPETQAEHNKDSKDIEKMVAITGMAFRFPGAKTQKEFWNNLILKKDSITKVSENRKKLAGEDEWDDWIGELDDIDSFDHEFFEIPLEEAIFMDPQQRLIMETSYEALDDAGVIADIKEENIGVYACVSGNTYNQLLLDYMRKNGMDGVPQNTLVRNLLNIVAASVAHQYNFTGPALAIDTACSSFLVSMHYATEALRDGSISGAVVASSNIMANKTVHMLAKNAGIVSKTNQTKVFDKKADGSVLGEGVVVIYLERLEDAKKGNKHIYGLVRGTAINNDGYSLGIMAPNPKGQFNVLKDAYHNGNLFPDEVTYIEAHGTGTTIGDPIEINALAKLFKECGRKQMCKDIGIGSVKTNMGHLLPTAGGAGLAKVLLCIKNKKIAPSLHMEEINPTLELDKTPFHVVTETQDWVSEDGKTRKAGITSLGLGGTNAHAIIEEWKEEPNNKSEDKYFLLTVSGATENALNKVISQTSDLLREIQDIDIADICFTRNRYRKHYQYRGAYIITSHQDTLDIKLVQGGSLKTKTGICIGDIKNYNVRDLVQNVEENSWFQTYYFKILRILETNNVWNFINEQIIAFAYSYALINSLMKKGVVIEEIVGINSGRIMADLLNQKINIDEALRLYLAYEEYVGHEVETNKYTDVVLNLFANQESAIYLSSNHNQDMKIDFSDKLEQANDLLLFDIMSRLYCMGTTIDWNMLHPDGTGKMVHIPAYPFEHKAVWIHQLKGENNNE